jgi:hypothetical protein
MQRVTRCRIGRNGGAGRCASSSGHLMHGHKVGLCVYSDQAWSTCCHRHRREGERESRMQNADVMARCRSRGRRAGLGEFVMVISSSKEVMGTERGRGKGAI